MKAKTETKDEILAAARAAGFPMTAPQLARLHRAGAIAEPEVRSLGRAKGRVSIYPEGTAAQVIRLVELGASERRLPERAWLLWWLDGGPMSDAASAYVTRAASKLDVVLEKMRALQRGEAVEIDGRETTIDDIYRAAEQERLSGVVGHARARTGKAGFSSVVAFLMQLSIGKFESFPLDRLLGTSEPEQQLIVHALGLARGRQEALAGQEPWLAGDLEEDFARLAGVLREVSFACEARQSDVILNRARVELRALMETVATAADFIDPILGTGAFSYRAMADALTASRYQDQVFALLAWSRMRHDRGLREGMEAIAALRGRARQMKSSLKVIERLRERVPALASLLAPERLAAAMLDASEMPRLHAALSEAHKDHADEIEAALATEPGVERVR